MIYLELAVAWLLFLAIPALAGGMLYRAWKILARREFRYVAPWHGRTVPQPERWAHWFAMVNLAGGALLLAILLAIVVHGISFGTWAGAVALTVWMYFIVTQLVARKARAAAG